MRGRDRRNCDVLLNGIAVGPSRPSHSYSGKRSVPVRSLADARWKLAPAGPNRFLRIAGGRVIVLPHVFERLGQGLEFGGVVDMAGVPGENELIAVVLCGEGAGEVLVGKDPFVHVVAHDVWIEEIKVAN